MPGSGRPIRRRVRALAVVAMVGVASTGISAAERTATEVVAGDVGTDVGRWADPPASPPVAPPSAPVAVQVLAINDFHGALEPPSGPGSRAAGVPAGGVEFLSTELARLSAEAPPGSTVTVAAGDLIGAAPLLSAAFHDEPAVEALGLAGLDLAGVGNHEFDEGVDELLRIQYGGCHPADGCADPARPYRGAGFQYLSANAVAADTGWPLLPPYAIEDVGGVRVGFIGMTLRSTPDFVTRSGVAGVGFLDEVETGNLYARLLQEQGVEAIVVLLHEGGWQSPVEGSGGGGVNDCTGLHGPIVPIVEGLSDAVDVVVSGHTHQAYRCVLDGKIVTSAGSDGQLVTDIDLRIDPVHGDVLAGTARNVVVGRDVPADPRQTELIERYRTRLGPAASRQVGVTGTAVTRDQEPLLGAQRGESALGDLVADAQLASASGQGAMAAFVDPDAVRADLDAGPVLDREALAVQPYNNYLTSLDLTGAQLDCLLEQQFVTGRTLQPSATVTYTVDPDGVTGTAADPCAGTRVHDLVIAGVPVDPVRVYRVAVSDFLADGGDGFSVLTWGSNRTVGALDLAALAGYLSTPGPVLAPETNRITMARSA